MISCERSVGRFGNDLRRAFSGSTSLGVGGKLPSTIYPSRPRSRLGVFGSVSNELSGVGMEDFAFALSLGIGIGGELAGAEAVLGPETLELFPVEEAIAFIVDVVSRWVEK